MFQLHPGEKYGRLTVVRFDHKNSKSIQYYLCKCDCGNEKIVDGYQLAKGIIKSCGCYRREKAKTLLPKMWGKKRKYIGCIECDSDEHYAKGLCRNCYNKRRYHNFNWDYKEPKSKNKEESLDAEKKLAKIVTADLLQEQSFENINYWKQKIDEAKTSNEISRCLYDIREVI